jgi:hypothetical protein
VREIPGGRSSSMAWCPGILRHGSYRTAVADPSREGGPLLPSPALASEHPGARTGRAVVLEHRAACGVSPRRASISDACAPRVAARRACCRCSGWTRRPPSTGHRATRVNWATD